MPRKPIESDDAEIIAAEREISLERPDDVKVEVIPAEGLKGLDLEKFMHEIVTVFIPEPYVEGEPNRVYLSVDGHGGWFERGREHKMRRTLLEALARAKTGRIQQRKIVNNEGLQSYAHSARLGFTYPFTVIHDPNPRGVAWLKSIMASQ